MNSLILTSFSHHVSLIYGPSFAPNFYPRTHNNKKISGVIWGYNSRIIKYVPEVRHNITIMDLIFNRQFPPKPLQTQLKTRNIFCQVSPKRLAKCHLLPSRTVKNITVISCNSSSRAAKSQPKYPTPRAPAPQRSSPWHLLPNKTSTHTTTPSSIPSQNATVSGTPTPPQSSARNSGLNSEKWVSITSC